MDPSSGLRPEMVQAHVLKEIKLKEMSLDVDFSIIQAEAGTKESFNLYSEAEERTGEWRSSYECDHT